MYNTAAKSQRMSITKDYLKIVFLSKKHIAVNKSLGMNLLTSLHNELGGMTNKHEVYKRKSKTLRTSSTTMRVFIKGTDINDRFAEM